MKVFFNFNEYLGGGETLLVRLAKSFSDEQIIVFAYRNSYISSELKAYKNIELHEYHKGYNFNYLSNKNKTFFLKWINNRLILKENIQFISFCMRDLYIVSSYVKKYCPKESTITHLLLHPLDHLYMCQSIFDKFLYKLKYNSSYSNTKNIECNKALLSALNKSNSLIPMNENVVDRIKDDFQINISKDNIVPLPYENFKIEDVRNNFDHNIRHQAKTRIVWVGRIVDFKIPAIKTMIDFISENEGYEFDIIGYGSENNIQKYIAEKKLIDKVKIIGKIENKHLKNFLKHYNIGYGMGTSIIELTNAGLPTIIALAKPDHKNFKIQKCGGFLFEQKIGNVGDDLYVKNKKNTFPLIKVCVDKIINDKDIYLKSFNYMKKNFSLETNLNSYKKIIDESKEINISNINNIKAGFIRKLLFRVFS